MVDTSIRVSEELADALYDLKTRGDSYEDVIWRLIEQGNAPGGREPAVAAAEPQADPEATETRAAHETAQEPPRDVDEEAPPEPVGPTGPTGAPTETDDVVSDVDRDQLRDELPGSGERLEARVEAILEMYRYLREHGHAEKSDLLEVVDAGAVGYASPDSVWSNMVKGRDTLRALPGVETPPTGRTEWRFIDEGDSSESGEVCDPTEEF